MSYEGETSDRDRALRWSEEGRLDDEYGMPFPIKAGLILAMLVTVPWFAWHGWGHEQNARKTDMKAVRLYQNIESSFAYKGGRIALHSYWQCAVRKNKVHDTCEVAAVSLAHDRGYKKSQSDQAISLFRKRIKTLLSKSGMEALPPLTHLQYLADKQKLAGVSGGNG